MRENGATDQATSFTVRLDKQDQLHWVRRTFIGHFGTALCGYQAFFSHRGVVPPVAARAEICPVCALFYSALPE